MFCSNCGNQILDNSKFCNKCGAKQATNDAINSAPIQQPVQVPVQQSVPVQEAVPVQQSAPIQQPVQVPVQQPKKSNKAVGIIITIAVVICAALIGKFVIAPSLTSDSNKNDSYTGYTSSQYVQPQQSTESNSEAPINPSSSASTNQSSSAYDAIFENTYIVHFQTFFGMDTASFASKQAGDIIYCSDYGYKNDVVKQWIETLYVPVEGLSENGKSQLQNSLKDQYANFEALSCCKVEYEIGTNYLTVKFTYSDVDQAAQLNELYNAGILTTNTYISMSATENTLLGQGFVKK